jgi:phosphoglycolate phosphatase
VNVQRFLVFDLDGTISDPIVGIVRSVNHALAYFGLPETSEAAVAPHLGPPIDTLFGRVSPARGPADIAALVGKFRERYHEIGYAENLLYPGMREVLGKLAAEGTPLGVCTAKRTDFAEKILSLFDLREYFRFVSGGDIGVRKADQLKALLASAHIPSDATMVGDRNVDIESAHLNGLSSVGVLWGYGTRDELVQANAERLVEQPAELLELAFSGPEPAAFRE